MVIGVPKHTLSGTILPAETVGHIDPSWPEFTCLFRFLGRIPRRK